MNSRQEAALAQLRRAVLAVLPHLSFGPGSRSADLDMWLAELERNHFAYSRLRTIASALRNLADELQGGVHASDPSAAAAALSRAATETLEAF